MSKLTIITKWDKIEENFPQNAGSNSGREWVITKFRIVVRRSRTIVVALTLPMPEVDPLLEIPASKTAVPLPGSLSKL